MSQESLPQKPRKRDRLDPRKVRVKGKVHWQVELGSELRDGKRYRLRKTFAARSEAETFAELRKIERTNHGRAGVSLSERIRGEALEAARLLAPYGESILEVVREHVRRKEASTRSETVANGVRIFLAAKAGDNLRARYLNDLRVRLARFAAAFGERKLCDLAAAEIDDWLRLQGGKPLTRNTMLRRLSTLFEFARQRGWVTRNPMVDVPKAKVSDTPPGILSVEEISRLLEQASDETLPIFALGAFAGLRSAELARLRWSDLHFNEKLIEVSAASSKTASRRLVTMPPNLASWLEPYRNHHGPIVLPGHYRQMVQDRRRAGITTWPSNALRHSYASYHLAAFRNAPALSLELGHTRPQTVFSHYREVVRPSEAEKFWKIVPAISAEAKIAVVA
jgi:integrase